ncbi:MAG: OmpA family protein, partial [Sulfurimonas sp.]|uniref:OmpA family protein n=1 Tax=Sulfurimonas sp. TaxID=2022749 RepID=UPI00263791D8
FSSRGELLWSKKYGSPEDDSGIDAVEAEDGSIVILGQKSSGSSKIPTILRVTQNGEKIWLFDIKGEKNTTAHKILKLRDNNFVLSLSQANDLNKEQIRLLKIDLQKNILLDKIIYTNYASVLKDIKEFSDGKIVGVGVVEDTYNTDGLAMLLDSKFKLLTQEHYGSDARDAFYALTILHNSQIGVAGIHTDKESQESNMWIVKLDSNLKMVQVTQKTTTTSFYAQLLELFKDEIAAKKLQIREDLSIELIDKSLYFNVGEFVLTSAQKLFLEKFSLKLLPFLKKNKELFKTLEVSGHTSSEWGSSDFSKGYINNTELSMKRSFSTISYIFNTQNIETKKWLSELLKGSGLSFSKRVIVQDNEDKEKSRRVSFKILL